MQRIWSADTLVPVRHVPRNTSADIAWPAIRTPVPARTERVVAWGAQPHATRSPNRNRSFRRNSPIRIGPPLNRTDKPPPSPSAMIKIASFNVENLYARPKALCYTD